MGLSPSLPVIRKAFWVPLRLKWGSEKGGGIEPPPPQPYPLGPNRYCYSLPLHVNTQNQGVKWEWALMSVMGRKQKLHSWSHCHLLFVGSLFTHLLFFHIVLLFSYSYPLHSTLLSAPLPPFPLKSSSSPPLFCVLFVEVCWFKLLLRPHPSLSVWLFVCVLRGVSWVWSEIFLPGVWP